MYILLFQKWQQNSRGGDLRASPPQLFLAVGAIAPKSLDGVGTYIDHYGWRTYA